MKINIKILISIENLLPILFDSIWNNSILKTNNFINNM